MDINIRLATYAHFYGQVDAILDMEQRNELMPLTALNRLREIVKEFAEAQERDGMEALIKDLGLKEGGIWE